MNKTAAALALIALIAACCIQNARPARAAWDDTHNWQLRLRAISVSPDEDSRGTIAGAARIDNAVVPELDITYFFTANFSAELILATSPHNVGWQPGGLNLGDAWVLPPTLLAQYHFMPDRKFSPYIGAGINYTIFYNVNPGAFASVEYDNGFGYALQIGADYKLDEHWMINADVKKIFLNTEVSVNNGAVRADVDLDPWVIGLGVGYRF